MRVNVPMTVAFDVGTPTLCVPDPAATVKSQRVRLFDIVVVGPLMIWGGVKAGGLGGATLALLGLTTVAYNARNYARVRAMAASISPAPAVTPTVPTVPDPGENT